LAVPRAFALRSVPAAIVLFRRPADLRLRDDAIAADAHEVCHALPALAGVGLEESAEAAGELANHVGADGVIEHRRGAHLHGAAAEEEIIQRVLEGRDAADAREALVGKRLREL